MKVVVVKPSRGTPPALADIVLKQDAWDDFGFKTQYQVYYFAEDQEAFVGNIKILQLGQMETPRAQRAAGGATEFAEQEFLFAWPIPRLLRTLSRVPRELRRFLLNFLRDALADPIHAENYEKEKGGAPR